MFARTSLIASALALCALAQSGCQFVPKSRLAAAELRNRALVEQTRGQLAEIANLNTHARYVEEQLRLTEQDLARLEENSGLDRQRLSNYERERDTFRQQLTGLRQGSYKVPDDLRRRLEGLAGRFPSLHYDSVTGISKLDTDVLFDTGKADLRSDARRMLDEFARLFQTPDAANLKVMVVGHTDNRQVAKRSTREMYPDNWHLSTSRALAVADYLRAAGMPESQLGVAGFAQNQPLHPNRTSDDRQRNRRVEIFVTGPDTPVVGWTESITSVYDRPQSASRPR